MLFRDQRRGYSLRLFQLNRLPSCGMLKGRGAGKAAPLSQSAAERSKQGGRRDSFSTYILWGCCRSGRFVHRSNETGLCTTRGVQTQGHLEKLTFPEHTIGM